MHIFCVLRFKYLLWTFCACCILTLICNTYFTYKGPFIPLLHRKKLATTPSKFSPYDNITLPPKGYLVWNENCRIPRIEPFSKQIESFYSPLNKYVCSKKKPLVWKTYDFDLEQYRLRIDEKRYNAGLFNCYYQPVEQSRKQPNIYNTEKCAEFHDNFLVPKLIRFGIIVQCISRSLDTASYEDALFFFQPRVTAQLNNTNAHADDKKNEFGIIMIGIDSISQINFRRTMPSTFAFLRRNSWFEFSGYNKMAWNTLPNLMGILCGFNISAATRHCSAYDWGYLDHCQFIFEKFRKYGFLTAYAEDTTDSATFRPYAGFFKPPTDFYLMPMLDQFERKFRKQTYCLGERLTASWIYDAATDFMSDIKKQPKFGLFWTNSFSHDDYDRPSSYDEHMLDYLEKWQRLGFYENNVLIFLSDHGMRWGKLHEGFPGFYEERLPTMFLWLPPKIRKKYPEFVYALTVNKNRLTSPFDIHMTLQHLLSISVANRVAIQAAESCPTCHSVLRPVNENRSCAEAGIPLHWCTCTPYFSVSSQKIKNLGIVDLVVDQINRRLRKYASGLCQELILDSITEAKFKSNDLSAEKYTKNFDLNKIDPQNEGVFFQVKFIAKPKELIYERIFFLFRKPPKFQKLKYEATFAYFQKSHKIDLEFNDIGLDFKYWKMSLCVDSYLLKRFCICL